MITLKHTREAIYIAIIVGYLIPLVLYLTDVLSIKTTIDQWFEINRKDTGLLNSQNAITYVGIVLSGGLGALTSKAYFQNVNKELWVPTNGKLNWLDLATIILLIAAGTVRIKYSIGHSQVRSEIANSGLIYYFGTAFLYPLFISRVIRNNSGRYFLMGIAIIFTTEIALLWKGFLLNWAIVYYILFKHRISGVLILLSPFMLAIGYSLLSSTRNRVTGAEATLETGMLTAAVNRIQGFSRLAYLIQSGERYDRSDSNDPTRQIDLKIWGLNEQTKNAIGGSAFGQAYFVAGYIGTFLYANFIAAALACLAQFATRSRSTMAVAVYLIGNINVLIIEGVGVKYWLAQASSLMLLLLIENATRHTAKMR